MTFRFKLRTIKLMPKVKTENNNKNSFTPSRKFLDFIYEVSNPNNIRNLVGVFLFLILIITMPLIIIATISDYGWDLKVQASCPQGAAPNDEIKPVVLVEKPIEGSYIAGNKLSVKVRATDNVCIRKVLLFIDGKEVKTFNKPPFTYSWNLRGVAAGTHVISVRAVDAADNISASSVSIFRSAMGLVEP